MANGVIGKLSLDISDVEKNINKINQLLKSIGAGPKVDLSSQVASEVKKQLDAIEKAINESVTKIQSASKRAMDAFNGIGAGGNSGKGLQSSIQKITEESTTMGVAVTSSGAIVEKFLSQATTGYDVLGRKIREVTDAQGNIVKRVQNERNAYQDALKILQDYYAKSAQMHALELGGKQNTTQYAKLASDVNNLNSQWANVNKHVQAVVLATDEAKRAADLYNNTMQALDAGKGAKDQETALKNLVTLYQEYYKTKAQADTFAQKGDILNADMYKSMSDTIKTYIDSIAQVNSQLDQEAQKKREVVEANLAYQTTVQSNAYREQQDAMTNYQNALVSMLNEQARFNQQVASGQLVEGTEKYAQSEEALKHLEQAAIQAGQKLDQAGRDAVMSMQNVQSAIDKVNVSMGAVNDSNQVSTLDQVTNAYNNLKNAINQYNVARKAGNEAGMNYWQDQIKGQMDVVTAIENGVNALNLEAGVRDQINQKIQEAKTLNDGFTKGVVGGTQATNELESQLTGMATRMFSLMAVFRAINGLVQNTVEYVTQYSDKMNEIQIITQKSKGDVEQLSQTYMKLAEQMNVSSLDMADAAIYFTRQGLAAEEIESRLVNVTRYAKTANVEFKDASEIITSVVNSMGLVEQEMTDGRNATQRVADVFLAVGDNAATSGQEIGEAMQKAAASAGAFGMSMEWLSAYIATVSETTRQEARTIGTAFNTIIARLHQIKQTGYNSEDETKINDVQKALAKIDITLMDQNNEWRNMDDIFQEIGAAWGELDGKTKSYIATTMAGVKQQNVFLALMNDLGKHVDGVTDGTEEGSRAWQLYNIAMDSAGTASEKYSIWTDSVTASQERLTVAQEKFYSLLDSGVIKSYNNVLAGFVNMVTDGAEALGSWNLIIPVIAGGITALAIATKGFSVSLAAMTASHPVLMGLAAGAAVIMTLVTAMSALGSAIETQEERFEKANQTVDESNERIAKYQTLNEKSKEMFKSFGDSTEVSGGKLSEYNSLLDKLADISPRCASAVQQLRDGLMSQGEAAKVIGDELERVIDKQKEINMIAMAQKYGNWSPDIADSGAMDVLKNWDKYRPEALDSIEEFAKQIRWFDENQHAFGNIEAGLNRGTYFTGNMEKFIRDAKKQYDYLDNDMMWDQIARDIWSKYFFGEGVSSARGFFADSMNQMIDEALSGITEDMDSTKAGLVREQLVNMLFGDDGAASTQEWVDSGKKIQQFLGNVLRNGIQLTPSDIVKYVGKSVFGNFFDTMFGDQLEELRDSSEFDEYAENVSTMYAEFLAAGMSNTEMADVLGELLLSNWETGIDTAKEKTKELIRNELGAEVLGEIYDAFEDVDLDEEQGVTSENFIDSLMWDDIDLGTLKTILNLVKTGSYTLEDFNKMMADAEGDVDKFKKSLNGLAKDNGLDEGLENSTKSLNEYVKTIKAADKEIDTLDKHLKTLKDGGKISFDDILDLASSHPDIMSVINDVDLLSAKLKELKSSSQSVMEQNIRDMIMNSPEAFAASPFADKVSKESGIDTLQKYMDSLEKESPEIQEASEYLEQTTNNMVDAAKNIDEATETWTKKAADKAKQSMAVDWAKNNNYAVQFEALQKAIKTGNPENLLNTWDSIGEEMRNQIASDYPQLVTALGEVEAAVKGTDEASQQAYQNLLEKREQIAEQMKEMAQGGNVDMTTRPFISQDVMQAAGWTDFEGDYATIYSSSYDEEIGEMHKKVKIILTPITPDGDVLSPEALDQYVSELLDGAMSEADITSRDSIANGGKGLLLGFNFDESKMHELHEEFYSLGEAAGDASTQMGELEHRLGLIIKANSAKYFKDSWKAVVDLSKGTISAEKALESFNKDLNNYKKAQQEVTKAQEKLAEGTELEEDDVSSLASVLNKAAADIVKDFPAAVNQFDDLTQAGQEVYEAMNRQAVMSILGTSNADFSSIEGGLLAVQSDAQATIAALMALGSFTIENENLPQEGKSFKPDGNGGGTWNVFHDNANVTFLRFDAAKNSPFGNTQKTTTPAPKKGGGGGGGGGKKEKTEAVKMLDNMGKVDDIQKWQQSYYQSQQKYYESTGQLQGVIAYMEKEKDAINEQTASLTENVKKLEEWIAKKKAELSGLKESDDKYAEVSDDLEKLQKAYQDYTKQLVDNKTAVNDLNKAMKEQQDKIRDMEIDLRETILKAIEDRERKTGKMLDAQIELENKVLDIIKRRYEKERDQIIETTELKIQALQEERDLLEEQLRLRKEQADEEDKAKKLKELELQYQRISADPTRAKEAKKIQKEISDLRKDMAWSAAEDEVKARKQSIEQQEQSLEEYIEQMREYYEDLFEHPKILIAQVEEILQMTSDEILEWLKTNDEAYAEFTAAQQEKTSKEWKQMLDDREGKIKTYWEEVEKIITEGDDAIIEFLKNNSEDYAAAGKLQAEKYVDEWKKKLDDLKAAYEEVQAELAPDTEAVTDEGDGGDEGGGGGGGPKKEEEKATSWSVTVDGKTYTFDDEDEAKAFRLNAQSGYGSTAGAGYAYITDADERQKKIDEYVDSKVGAVVTNYRTGGLANFTGPAWLDGTPSAPERVLSPRQTQLFESMIEALERMSRISIPTMPNFSDLDLAGSSNVSVGDIIVNVDNLDTDDDYEELAKKVSDILMERIGRTTVVGGLRINSF